MEAIGVIHNVLFVSVTKKQPQHIAIKKFTIKRSRPKVAPDKLDTTGFQESLLHCFTPKVCFTNSSIIKILKLTCDQCHRYHPDKINF